MTKNERIEKLMKEVAHGLELGGLLAPLCGDDQRQRGDELHR